VGNVFVVAAEPKLRVIGVHQLPETCMATPAISNGMLLFRTRHSLIAIGEGGRSEGMKLSSQTSAATEPPPLALTKPDAALIGDWLGTLEVGAVKLRVRFSIQTHDGGMKGTMTSLDQGIATVNLSRVGENEGTVHLQMDEKAAHFKGRWNETKDQLKGEWHQFDRPLPLVLNKQRSEKK
jgi:hypothetical protein